MVDGEAAAGERRFRDYVTDPPPSTVDIELAVRTAYRTRRRRVAVAAGAAVVALLVGAGSPVRP